MSSVVGLAKFLAKPLEKIMYLVAARMFISRYSLRAWQKAFVRVARNSTDISVNLALHIARSRGAMKLYYRMFFFSKRISVRDLMLVIGMELLDTGIRLDEKLVLQYIYAIYNDWIDLIASSDLLRQHLEKNLGVSVHELRCELDAADDSQMIALLRDKTKLRSEFFSSYSDPHESYDVVRVFLPNEHGYIDRSESLSVDIRMNRYMQLELGFFRVGYDYSLLSNDGINEGSAWVVTLSNNKKKEAVRFGDITVGLLTNNCIWAR